MCRSTKFWFVATTVAGLLGASVDRAEEPIASADEYTLRSAGLGTSGPDLVHFLRSRARPSVELAELEGLMGKLRNPDPVARRRAEAELIALGPPAVALLRKAAKDFDSPECAEGAAQCLRAIEDTGLPAAVARLAATARSVDSTAALLAYLPFADDLSVVEEVQAALDQIAVHVGVPDAAVLAAIQDDLPIRRSVAAVALCRSGGIRQAAAVHKLLRDPNPVVRLQVALALGALLDGQAIPVLISSIDMRPVGEAEKAEAFLRDLAGELSPAVTLRTRGTTQTAVRDAWQEWWRSLGPAPLTFFRRRTLADRDLTRIRTLIRQLGDDDFDVRLRATSELTAFGSIAAPYLHSAAQSADVEVANRAAECLRGLEHDKQPGDVLHMARLLALQKTPEAVEALLAFGGHEEDPIVLDSIRAALTALAIHDEKPEPSLLGALENQNLLTRVMAGEALCRAGFCNHPVVRQTLKDSDAKVRLRMALAFTAAEDAAAIPVLIELLDELAVTERWRAEEVLERLAGEQAPVRGLEKSGDGERRYHAAWLEWWRTHETQVDMRRQARPRLLGHKLIVQTDANGMTGRVSELGVDGKPRWQIAALALPTDAHVLPGNRVLIAEQNGLRVTERDLQGNILWQEPATMPVGCQRLPDGNTLITCLNQVLEVTREHKEVFSYRRGAADLLCGVKLRNGQLVCMTRSGLCIRLDAKGNELKTFAVGHNLWGSMDVLSDGRVLIPIYSANKVVEYDPEGRAVWQAMVTMPNAAVRLPSGNTLVVSQPRQTITELDRLGRVVREQKTDGRPWRVRER